MRARLSTAALALAAVCGCGGAARAPAPAAALASVAVEAPRSAAPAPPADRAGSLLARAQAARDRQHIVEIQLFALEEATLGERAVARLEERRAGLDRERERASDDAVAALTELCDDPALAAYERRDAALMLLARALRERSAPGAAATRLEDLVKRHPRSAFVPEALSVLADLAFAEGRLEDTLAWCDRIAGAGGAPGRRIQAEYLRAWALRGLGDDRRPGALDEAMRALREVIRLAAAAGDREGPSGRIAETAELELVELYALHGDPDGAADFFAEAGGRAPRLMALYARRLERPSTRSAPGLEPSRPVY